MGADPVADGDELQERALRNVDTVTAELASVGVDTGDLLRLLDSSDEDAPTTAAADHNDTAQHLGRGSRTRNAR